MYIINRQKNRYSYQVAQITLSWVVTNNSRDHLPSKDKITRHQIIQWEFKLVIRANIFNWLKTTEVKKLYIRMVLK